MSSRGQGVDRMKMELITQDQRTGVRDSSYTKMDMGGMGKMMMGGGDRNSEDNPAPKEKSKGGFGFKDAIDLLK
jgi:hypothetical protein